MASAGVIGVIQSSGHEREQQLASVHAVSPTEDQDKRAAKPWSEEISNMRETERDGGMKKRKK